MVVTMVVALSANVMAAPQDPSGTAAWNEKKFRRLTSKDDPLVVRAEQVFSRVAAAADSTSARPPHLLLLKKGSDKWADAISDGTVLISQEALAICYQGVSSEKGDSRLAFLLSHELAHHAKNDMWHSTAIESMKGFVGAGDKTLLKKVADYIKGASDYAAADVPEEQRQNVAKAKELQADGYGIVYMTMAGYDPRAVIAEDGSNFIEEFAVRAGIKDAKDKDDAAHPSASKRAAFLKTQLAAVADEVELFRIGVRYYQQGRYDESIPYFDRFRVTFPSREVFNNLGLSWYQIALESLSQCDTSLAFRYKLPALLDTETLAAVTRGKGSIVTRDKGSTEACLENNNYRNQIGEAVKFLELARAKDPRYVPARINLASALLMAGVSTSAKAVVDEALKLAPDSSDAALLQAVALYRMAKDNGLDATDKALTQLTALATGAAPRPDAMYNMAAIEQERGRTAAMQSHLETFLKLEKAGPYAANAARLLGTPAPAAVPAGKRSSLKSTIPTGDVQAATEKILQAMTKREVVVGAERATIYRGKGSFALTRDDGGQELVELVEAEQSKPQGVDAFRKANGSPRRILTTPAGQTLIYNGFSTDVVNGQVRTLIFFAPKDGI